MRVLSVGVSVSGLGLGLVRVRGRVRFRVARFRVRSGLGLGLGYMLQQHKLEYSAYPDFLHFLEMLRFRCLLTGFHPPFRLII